MGPRVSDEGLRGRGSASRFQAARAEGQGVECLGVGSSSLGLNVLRLLVNGFGPRDLRCAGLLFKVWVGFRLQWMQNAETRDMYRLFRTL